MLKKQMDELNKGIRYCEYFKKDSPLCKHKNKEAEKILHPIVHVPLYESQKILIITQSPSNETNSQKVDENKESPANFRCRVYSLIFFGTDEKKYMDITKKNYKKLNASFSKYFYWIHYFKCYPGKAKGGDKRPIRFCANRYLENEIKYFDPKLILTVGKLPENYLRTLPEEYLCTLKLNCEIIHSLHPSPAAQRYRKKYKFHEKWKEYKKKFEKYFDKKDINFVKGLSEPVAQSVNPVD